MKIYKILFSSCILWFVFLCLLHYFSFRPLWLDEDFVFRNLQELKPLEILGPLRYDQTFPRVYLVIIDFFARTFNYNLLALRFLPLLSMLLAFFVWLRIYRQAFSDKWQALLAAFSFASSYRIIYYSAELKPYSMDVLVSGIFCWYLIRQKELIGNGPSKPFVITTLLLPFTLLLSYGSFFCFWLIIYNLLFMAKRNPKAAVLLAGYVFLCVLLIIFVYYIDLRHALGAPSSVWNNYFLSTQSPLRFIETFGEGLRKLTTFWFGNSRFFIRAATVFIPVFLFSLFGYGIKSLRSHKFRLIDMESFGLIIFLELVVLGMMRKYPFTGARITLFFAPLVFFLIIKGIGYLKANKPLYLSLNIFYICFLAVCSLNSFFTYLKLYNN